MNNEKIDYQNMYETIIRDLVIMQYKLYEEIEKLYKYRYDSNESLNNFIRKSYEIKTKLELIEYLLKRYDINNISKIYLKLKGVDDVMKYVR